MYADFVVPCLSFVEVGKRFFFYVRQKWWMKQGVFSLGGHHARGCLVFFRNQAATVFFAHLAKKK